MPSVIKQTSKESKLTPQKDEEHVKGGIAFLWLLSLLPFLVLYKSRTSSNEEISPSLRAPASLTQAKVLKEGKAHSALQITISLLSTDKVTKGVPFKLQAQITTKHPVKNATILWILPEGVQVVEGEKKFTVDELDGTENFEILLVTDSTKNQQIHVSVKGQIGSSERGGVSQFNTITTDTENTQKNFKPLEQKKSKTKILY